jgi:hypothetical protein
MFKVLILICSMHVAPHDCERGNAIDVIVGPTASNELTCGFATQAYVAGTALAPAGENYLKIQCMRPSLQAVPGAHTGRAPG